MRSILFRCCIHCLLSISITSHEVVAASLSRHGRHHRTSLNVSHPKNRASGVLAVDNDDDDDSDQDGDARQHMLNQDGEDRDTDEESSKGGRLQKKMQHMVENYLGKSYDKESRPLPDSSVFEGTHRIKVYVGLKLVKMLEIHQIAQTFKVAVWLRRMWPDYRLKYDAAEYFGGTSLLNGSWDSENMWIPVEQDRVWMPEIHVINSVAPPEQIWKDDSSPRVLWYDKHKLKKSGYNMVLVTPEILTVSCPMALADFPFDTQDCHIQFGGWTAGEKYFELGAVQMEEGSRFRDGDTEFHIEALSPVRKSFKDEYLAGKQPVPTVVYPIRFVRKPNFYLLTIILPMFLLVLLGQALYWMDMGKERLSTGITIVLAVMAVTFLVEPLMPKTREVLWIEKFQVGCYILTCSPLFVSILLDHVVMRKICTEDQGALADRIARIVHPMIVFIYYLVMFGVPGFGSQGTYKTVDEFGNVTFSRWPYDVPTIMGFLVFNMCVFSVFLASACMEFPFIRKHLPKVPEADTNDERSSV